MIFFQKLLPWCLLALLTACGQKGALYLPAVHTPIITAGQTS